MMKKLLSKVLSVWITIALFGGLSLSDYVYAQRMNKNGGTNQINLSTFKFNKSSAYTLKQIKLGTFQAKLDNIVPSTIKPSELKNVRYRLKNNVEIIP